MKRDDANRNQQARQEAAAAILNTLLPWIEALIGTTAKEGRNPGVQDSLTFEEVVAYFTRAHNGDPAIAGGALYRRPHPQGHLVFQVFLNDNNELIFKQRGFPMGRVLIARRFDDELDEKFANVDLVLFR